LQVRPGEDIKEALLALAVREGFRAACVLTCVGSITECSLRLANAEKGKSNPTMDVTGRHEIVSLVGTFSNDGCHLHTSLADCAGKVVGGHLMGDMRVFTTAEIVVGECQDIVFARELDECTG
ncbi:hypothetical protein T484DRAFT_1571313, partial [Baffinella frigidus]